MDVKEIREAFEQWRSTAENTDKRAFADGSSRNDILEAGFLAGYKAALSTIDPEAIKRACADAAVDQFWKELHEEAEVQCDWRVGLLGKIETSDDAAIRKNLLDGWSAWILAKRIVSERNNRAAVLQAEPGREV